MPRQGRSGKVPREKASAFLRKAEDFAATMGAAMDRGAWNGAGLAAVHCVISSCDAVTTFLLSERSRGESHSEVSVLLARLPGGHDQMTRQISLVLQEKNRIEYDPGEFGRAEAEEMAKRAERVLAWARAALG